MANITLQQSFGNKGKEREGKAELTERKKKREKERKGTHGKEKILYKTPILVPISDISDICATHGLTTDTKEPEKNP